MAIRIRCLECRKRLSIDDAFAGGVCRCPYCRTIMEVPESRSPRRKHRPATPDQLPEEPIETPSLPDDVPIAKTVRLQSRLALWLMIGIVVMLAIGAIVFMLSRSQSALQPSSEPASQPPGMDAQA